MVVGVDIYMVIVAVLVPLVAIGDGFDGVVMIGVGVVVIVADSGGKCGGGSGGCGPSGCIAAVATVTTAVAGEGRTVVEAT